MSAVYFGFLFLLFPCLFLCSNSALKARITKKGIDYGFQLGIETVKAMIRNVQFPDISGNRDSLRFNILQLHILHPSFPQSSMNLIPPNGIQVSLQDAQFTLQGNLAVTVFPIIDEHKSLEVFVSGTSISSSIGLTRDSAGRPKMQSSNCRTTVRSVSFRSLDNLLQNFLQNILQRQVEDLLNQNLCKEMSKLTERLNAYLTTLQVSTQFGPFVQFQYDLVDHPLIGENYIDLNFKGSFRSIRNHTEPPFSPDQLEISNSCNQTHKMLCIGISEYFFNSAAYTYFMAGALSMDITDDMILQSSQLRVTTDSLALFIPEITGSYISMPMVLHLSVREPPHFTIEEDKLILTLSGSMQMFVLLPNSSRELLIQMRLEAVFKINLRVAGEKIYGSISDSNFHFILTNIFLESYQCNSVFWDMNPTNKEVRYCTPEGKRNTKPATEQIKLTSLCKLRSDRHLAGLKMMMSQATNMFVIPMVNEKLSEGFPLPVIDNIKFVSSSLKSYQGFFLITTDLEFLS